MELVVSTRYDLRRTCGVDLRYYLVNNYNRRLKERVGTMTAEEKCAERYTEGTGGYLVCVDETRQHDTTVETVGWVCSAAIAIAFFIFMYFASRKK